MKELQLDRPWMKAVSRAAAVLYDAGATAVWLFGSRARDQAPDKLSDFDLSVEGLPHETGCFGVAARQLKGKVDIIRLESATPALRREIMCNRIFIPRAAYAGEGFPWRPQLPDSLAGMRTRTVARLIRDVAPRSVIDFGCGFGWLLAELAADRGLERLTGVDLDDGALAQARQRIARASGPGWDKKVSLRAGLITCRDPAFLGHDAAAAIEVIEHLEWPQLDAFIGVLFDFVQPLRAVVTTPNAEYNVLWLTRRPRSHRHPDHRFEWSCSDFTKWANRVATVHGYEVCLEPVGTIHAVLGPPTQLAVFDKRG